MKQNFYFLIIFLTYYSVYSQRKEIPAVIINDKNDTIRVDIKVDVNFFDQALIRELSILKKIKYLDSKGAENKIFAKNVKELIFEDLKGEHRIFKFDGKNKLHEVIYEGIIKVYVVYSANSYDGSQVAHMNFYDEKGKRIKPGVFGTSKTSLKKVVKEIPELVKLIDESTLTHKETIVFILTKYEKEYLTK